MKDWQAALIGFGVLLLMAETDLGPLAVAIAWGIAITEGLAVAISGVSPLQQLTQGYPKVEATLHQNPAVPPTAGSPNLAPSATGGTG